MSDVEVDLEAERAAAEERKNDQEDTWRARRMAERLFTAAEDKTADLADRQINDAIAEGVGFASYDGERMKQFIGRVRAGYAATRAAWIRRRRKLREDGHLAGPSTSIETEESATPEPESEEEDVTHKEWVEEQFEVRIQALARPVKEWGENRLADFVVGVLARGKEAGRFIGNDSGTYYNHIRPVLVETFGVNEVPTFGKLIERHEREWDEPEEINTKPEVESEERVDPVHESTHTEEAAEEPYGRGVQEELEGERLSPHLRQLLDVDPKDTEPSGPRHQDRLELEGPWGSFVLMYLEGGRVEIDAQMELGAELGSAIAAAVLRDRFGFLDGEPGE